MDVERVLGGLGQGQKQYHRYPFFYRKKRSIFEKEWEVLPVPAQGGNLQRKRQHQHNDRKKMFTARDVVTQKFLYAVGSARWMMNYTTDEIDKETKEYLAECALTTSLISYLSSLDPRRQFLRRICTLLP